MRGDPQVELRGAVLVGRRVVPQAEVSTTDELVTVKGLLLRIDSRGLTVEGPRPNVVHTVSWQRVRSIEAGGSATFEDAKPARSIQVELDDRRVQFLVPVEALGEDQLRVLDTIVSRHLGRHPRLPNGPGRETLGPIVRTTVLAVGDPVQVPRVPAPPPASVSAPIFTSEQAEDNAPREAPASQIGSPTGESRPALMAPMRRSPGSGVQIRRIPGPDLPPPPPSSSVVMPPKPADAGSPDAIFAKEPKGRSQNLQGPFGIDKDLLQPPAVPAARRVRAPVPRSTDATQLTPDPGHVPPLLPPPPPGGSWSRLPPPPVELLAESQVERRVETRQGDAAATLTEAGPAGPVTEAEATTDRRGGDRKSRRQRKRRSRRLTAFGGTLLVVAAAVGGSLFGLAVTDSGSPPYPSSQSAPGPATRASSGGSPRSLSGPSSAADAGTIARTLNIAAAGLPSGWHAGRAPWARVATPQSDDALAGCLGISVTRLGILSGTTERNGPQVVPSGW
ncbi:MAG: hypothetical protein ACLP6E_00315, partial [Acidimicrobiales bacterium]